MDLEQFNHPRFKDCDAEEILYMISVEWARSPEQQKASILFECACCSRFFTKDPVMMRDCDDPVCHECAETLTAVALEM